MSGYMPSVIVVLFLLCLFVFVRSFSKKKETSLSDPFENQRKREQEEFSRNQKNRNRLQYLLDKYCAVCGREILSSSCITYDWDESREFVKKYPVSSTDVLRDDNNTKYYKVESQDVRFLNAENGFVYHVCQQNHDCLKVYEGKVQKLVDTDLNDLQETIGGEVSEEEMIKKEIEREFAKL